MHTGTEGMGFKGVREEGEGVGAGTDVKDEDRAREGGMHREREREREREGEGVGAGRDVKDVYFTGSSTMIEPEYIEPKRAQQAHASFPPSFLFSFFLCPHTSQALPLCQNQSALSRRMPLLPLFFSFFFFHSVPILHRLVHYARTRARSAGAYCFSPCLFFFFLSFFSIYTE
jgi:hypothetical protein